MAMLFGTVENAVAVGKRHLTPVAPDSSNFIRASVMYFSPLDEFSSSMGHCALHMECPSEGFDVIFSQTVVQDRFEWKQLLGRFSVRMESLVASDVLARSKREGRMVSEWQLNLTHHEKQRLWMLLDKTVKADRSDDYFCIVNSHCVAAVLYALEQCTIDEYIDIENVPEPLTLPQGDYMRWSERDYPWYSFMVVTMGGDGYDRNDPAEHIVCPEVLFSTLQYATLRPSDNVSDTVAARPLLIGNPRQLLPLVNKQEPSAVTPWMVFMALLAVTVLVTLLEWLLRQKGMARIFDRTLFSLYAVWSVVVLWLAVMGMSFTAAQWNWYIVPFNPIPVVVWLCYRRHPQYHKVFWLYAVVLALFLLATPLSAQIDAEHQFITASLLIRCIRKIINTNNNKNKTRE